MRSRPDPRIDTPAPPAGLPAPRTRIPRLFRCLQNALSSPLSYHISHLTSRIPRLRLPGAWTALPWCLFIVGLPARTCLSHPLLSDYVEHHIVVRVDRENIDVEIDLTFHDMRSLLERRRMDADHNGLVTRDETAAYLAQLADSLEDALVIHFEGRPLPATLLYDPQVDLAGNVAAMGVRHVLKLAYFARTPRPLSDGTLEIDDRLWPAAAATGSLETKAGPATPVLASTPLEVWLPGKDSSPRVLALSVRSTAGADRAVTSHHQEIQHAPATRPGVNPPLRRDPAPRRRQRG